MLRSSPLCRTLASASRSTLASSSRFLSCTLSSSAPPVSSSSPSSAASSQPTSPISRPGPPPLPPAQQREFEALQKAAQTVDLSAPDGEVHRDLRRSPKPDFKGEVNPKTGEVGGPKRDPLLYEKEWTYGGRATDFVTPPPSLAVDSSFRTMKADLRACACWMQ